MQTWTIIHRRRALSVLLGSTRRATTRLAMLALLVRLTWTVTPQHRVMCACLVTMLMLVLQCARRVALVLLTTIRMRARRVRTATLDTSHQERLSTARYVLLAFMITIWTLQHLATPMRLHAQWVTTRVQDQPAATPVLLDRPTSIAVQPHRAIIVVLDVRQ